MKLGEGELIGRIKINKEPYTLKRTNDVTGDRLDHILQLKLSELAKRNIALKIYSDILNCELWLCSNKEMVSQIKQDDPEAVIYTVDELRKLFTLRPTPEDLRRILDAKTVFPGSRTIDSRLKETSDGSDGT